MILLMALEHFFDCIVGLVSSHDIFQYSKTHVIILIWTWKNYGDFDFKLVSHAVYLCADFILEFLRQLGDLSEADNTSASCQDAYNKTLAKHHSWLIRKAAIVAMYTMPTREMLFKKVLLESLLKNFFFLFMGIQSI